MRVVIVGGYGVFGSLLSELLVRDGHTLWIAGRDLAKAEQLAGRLGAHALGVDLFRDPEQVFTVTPDVVVDAAGPYQLYGADPYRLARLCIEQGVHYLDLSDSAAFTAGIGRLDQDAEAEGVCVLSGASSVPGLSSVVATHLSTDLDQIIAIDTAILPGNKAPRGRSVIASILGSVGQPIRLWQGGAWTARAGWSGGRAFQLDKTMRRTGYLISVPDCELFPQHFDALSVRFYAGLELPIMNAALSWLRHARKIWTLDLPGWAIDLIQGAANLLMPLGTDRGGMIVTVTGRRGQTVMRRQWRLIAEAGQGPYMPGIMVRVLLRQWDEVRPGARPCLAEVSLDAVRDAMSDLTITTHEDEEHILPLFQQALGDHWQALSPQAKALHDVYDVHHFAGTARVDRGGNLLAKLTALVFGFPPAAPNVAVTVTKTRTDAGEVWTRDFGGRTFSSLLMCSPKPHHVRERFGPFTFEQELLVSTDGMSLEVRRGWFFRIPLPRWALPKSAAREYVEDGRFHFDVALSLPILGSLIVRYRGSLEPVLSGSASD